MNYNVIPYVIKLEKGAQVQFPLKSGWQHSGSWDVSPTCPFKNRGLSPPAAMKWGVSCSVVLDSLRPLGLGLARLFCPWDSSSKNTGVGCRFLLQGIFLIQGLNLGLLHCKQTLYCLSHRGHSSTNCHECCRKVTLRGQPLLEISSVEGQFKSFHR